MKTLSSFFFVVFLALSISSCGFNQAPLLNTNSNNTDVELASNNFRVVERVNGSADITYIFGIGGMNATQLHDNAYTAMITKANLVGSSKAIANVLTEWHVGGFFPIFYTATVTVSANIIEFTK